jgi:hypothetical protein
MFGEFTSQEIASLKIFSELLLDLLIKNSLGFWGFCVYLEEASVRNSNISLRIHLVNHSIFT